MKLMFEIEEAVMEAEALTSMMLAVMDAGYNGNYGFDDYEPAFNYLCSLSYNHFKKLEQLKDKAFALSNDKKS